MSNQQKYCCRLVYKHSQVIKWANCGAGGLHREEIRAENTVQQPAVCWGLGFAEQCALMCFTGLTADRDEGIDDAACHCVVEKKKRKRSLVSRPGERRLFRSLQTCLCFCNSLNTGVVIIFGLHPGILPSLSYTLWFGRVLQGFKGKLMLLQMHVFLFCFVFNSWYLLVFLAFQT